MAVAISLQHFLDNSGIKYSVVPHPYADNSQKTADAAHVSASKIAKCVILEDEGGYVMAVVPATRKVKLGELFRQINRRLELASESELADLLGDCVLGAVPPIGEIYDMDVVVDDSFDDLSDIYFEAGDHTDLIHIRGEDFQTLMHNAEHASFSHAV